MSATPVAGKAAGGGSVAVAAGILASRLMGLVRQKVFAFYLGAGAEADAFNLAFRIPNLLQNLFGEGALSASFIPVYSRLLSAGDDDARQRLAGAVFALLALGMTTMALVGVLAAPWLVDLVASGVEGSTRALTITLVRILFPGAAVLVLSAWCLGVLNSHRRFLLSYASPVIWNAMMIGALVWYGSRTPLPRLTEWLAWASVAGSVGQVLVQWPSVHQVLGAWRLSLGLSIPSVRTVLRNFGPALIGRGVTQISAYVDTGIASHLITGSATMLSNSQVLYMLPVSLFGISISASQLPAMSGEGEDDAAITRVRTRLNESLLRVAFFVVPCVAAFVAIGDAVGSLVFQGGRFGAEESQWLWGTLAASSVGLLAATLSRLYSTTLYALQDTRTPQRRAVVRVVVGAGLAMAGARWGPALAGVDDRWSVAFLALGSACAAWIEWALLRRDVARRVGTAHVESGAALRIWGAAAAAAGAASALRLAGVGAVTFAVGAPVLFAVVYGVSALALGVQPARVVLQRLRRRR